MTRAANPRPHMCSDPKCGVSSLHATLIRSDFFKLRLKHLLQLAKASSVRTSALMSANAASNPVKTAQAV